MEIRVFIDYCVARMREKHTWLLKQLNPEIGKALQ
jgi:hypothetical protein